MDFLLAATLLAIIAVLAVAMLRELAIHGLGLPGQEEREWKIRARKRSAAQQEQTAMRRRISGPAVKAAGRAAGVGLLGGVLAAVVGAAGGTVAVIAVIAWYSIG